MNPSVVHEQRVALLDQMSRLAGCTVPCTLGRYLYPDVLLAHPSARLIFLGEAKRSETPGNAQTIRRLRRYMRAVRSLQRRGYGSRLALSGDAAESESWARLLNRLALSEQVAVDALGSVEVAWGERVVWLDLLPRGVDLSAPAAPRLRLQPV